jgi:glycosyltransferase involved in cell wall biosynthesis
MDRKVSIIVPVFNTEKYLRKCIDSCLCQTHQNIEVIAVNDGSRDNSLKILNELADNDDRLKVIHKHNEGVSKARYIGVENSSGDYLFFLDSDDWLEKSVINDLLSIAVRDNSDIVISGFYSVSGNERIICEQFDSKNISVQEFCLLFLKKELHGGLWAKLFRRNKWAINGKDIDFSIKNNEDYLVLMQIALSVSTISLSADIGYNYFHREDSASKQKRPQVAFDVIIVTYSLVELLRKQIFYKDLIDALINFSIEQIYFAITCYTYCYRDERFDFLFNLVKSKLGLLRNRKMYLILNSYKFGKTAFIFVVGSIKLMKKIQSLYFQTQISKAIEV